MPGDAVLVSACLVGVRCRYDGESKNSEEVTARLARLKTARVVPVCPEQLGGLPTPRSPCEVLRLERVPGTDSTDFTNVGDFEIGTGEEVLEGRARIVNEEGEDKTDNFLRGAQEALRVARLVGARRAILKTDSPSCDPAKGVTAAVLRREGLELEAAG